MSLLLRILHVFRRGPRKQRLLAVLGLVLAAGAAVYVFWKLLDLVVALGVFFVGLYLLVQSVRQSQRPS